MTTDNLAIALKEAGKLITNKFKGLTSSQKFKSSGELDKSFRYESTETELNLFAAKYAGALSDGISTGRSGSAKDGEELQRNIIKWAKTKGIRPQIKDKKGRFTKVTDRTWKSLGFVLARSIRNKGISKRFGYKGSGFIKTVKDQSEKEVMDLITEGYRKDLLIELNRKA